MRKKFGPTRYPKEKNFKPTRHPEEKNLDPQNRFAIIILLLL